MASGSPIININFLRILFILLENTLDGLHNFPFIMEIFFKQNYFIKQGLENNWAGFFKTSFYRFMILDYNRNLNFLNTIFSSLPYPCLANANLHILP